MKKILNILLVACLGLMALSCNNKEYDDSKIQDQLKDLQEQVDQLKTKVNDLNIQVVGLKEVLDQWKEGGYIMNVDQSIPGQYTLTFLDGKTIVLYDSQAITVREEDGEYYWYVGDRKLGPAACIPEFSTNEKGELIVTVNGDTINLGELSGKLDIKALEVKDGKVIFTLSDDTTVEIPLAMSFKLVIENAEQEVSDGDVLEFPYTVQGANASTTVDAFAGGNYAVKVEAGKVVVTVPTPAVPGQVLVWAQNGQGLFSMVKLAFDPSVSVKVVSTSEDLTAIPGEGGDVVVNLVSNVEVELEEIQEEWLSAELTKADYTLTLTLTKNETDAPREAQIHILRSDTKDVVQTINLVQLVYVYIEPKFTVKRVWGKFSTETEAWHSYLNGFHTNADRNVTMDDNYVYVAEAAAGVKKIWALNLADGSFAKNLPVSTVKDAGTFPLCCPRVVNLGGTPTLIVSNMTENALEDNLYVYVYENGIDADPTPVQMKGATNGRLGDTFSYWGASATNSADGQGITKGLLYFDGNGNGNGISLWKTTWTKGSLPAESWVHARYGFDNGNTAAGAFWTYPDTKDAGIWGGRGTPEDFVQSAYGSVKEGATNLWNASGDQTANTECNTINNGYYNNVTAYQFFNFNDKPYIAYSKQVDGTDGRFILLEGEATGAWKAIVPGILANRNIVYQAAIQEDAEMQDEYNASPLASGHSGMDLGIRAVGDKVYIVVLKQNVGLSLFSVSIE